MPSRVFSQEDDRILQHSFLILTLSFTFHSKWGSFVVDIFDAQCDRTISQQQRFTVDIFTILHYIIIIILHNAS